MHRSVVKQLQELAEQSPLHEICGVIGTDHTIYPIRNAAKSKTACYVFDKREYFDLLKRFKDAGIKVLCLYHSHPTGDVTPSKADLEYTKQYGVPQIIVSAKEYMVVTNA